jgi:hypothetical protein
LAWNIVDALGVCLDCPVKTSLVSEVKDSDMNDLSDQISKLVDEFVAQVTSLARKAAIDTLSSALGSAAPALGNGLGGRGRGRGRGRIAVPSARSLAKGAKRPPGEISLLKEKVFSYITSSPGQRIEQINKELGTSTRELSLPLKKLISEGAVRTEGEKRATTYFPGDGKPQGSGRKKRRRG